MSRENLPQEPAPKQKRDLYMPLWPIARTILNHRFERTVLNTENIPEGPAIFAPNHVSFFDSPLIAVSYTEATGIPMRFAAKKEYFDGKGVNDKGKYGRSLRWLMEHSYMLPVDRQGMNLRTYQEFERAVGARLTAGDSVALHPEGTRSKDGRLYKFKSGAARIAMKYEVPIVPVGIVYPPSGDQRKGKVEISFGEPVSPDKYTNSHLSLFPRAKRAEKLIQIIENDVAEITGMEQVGEFAKLPGLSGEDGGSK